MNYILMVKLKNKEDMRILQEELADQKEIDDIRHAKKLNEIRKLLEDIEIMIASLKKEIIGESTKVHL